MVCRFGEFGDKMKHPIGEEPYFGDPMVVNFDKMLTVALEKATLIAPRTQLPALTDIQAAATDLIPDGISLCCATRELIRSGYLTAAFVLQRPIWERAATLQYLFENPNKVRLWRGGWPHKSRPSLLDRLSVNGGDDANKNDLKKLVEMWNSIVHGDPLAADILSTAISSRVRARSFSKQVKDSARCQEICVFSTSALVVFTSLLDAIFTGGNENHSN